MTCSYLAKWSVGDIILLANKAWPGVPYTHILCLFDEEDNDFAFERVHFPKDISKETFEEIACRCSLDEIIERARNKLGISWRSAVFAAHRGEEVIEYRVGLAYEYAGQPQSAD